MKYQTRLLAALPLLGLLFLALACAGGEEQGKLRLVATTTQIGDFARNVGGDRVSLSVLLKPNQDAHDFEPEPSQLRALAAADLVLRNGLGLDAFLDKALGGGGRRVVVVTEGIALRSDKAGPPDPHVWLAVANAKRMVENLGAALTAADPANAPYYEANAGRYLESLDALDTRIRARVAEIPPACRKLVTNHDVLGYYAEAYGFRIVGAVIPSTSTEARPSALDVADIVRRVRAESVPAIFAEASSSPALIEQVGREAGVKVIDDLYGDSLGLPGSDGATYVAMMDSNTRKIVAALKGC